MHFGGFVAHVGKGKPMSIEDEIERSIVRAVMFSGSEEFLKKTSDVYTENISTLRRILPTDVNSSLSFFVFYQDDAGIHDALCCVLNDQVVVVWRNGFFRRREYRVIPSARITSVDYRPFSVDSGNPSITLQCDDDKIAFSIPRRSAPLPDQAAHLLQTLVQ